MRLRAPNRMFVIRYRKRDGINVPDFLVGVLGGAGLAFLAMLFAWDSSDRERDKQEREREEKLRAELAPSKIVSKPAEIKPQSDTFQTAFTLYDKNRCWEATAPGPEELKEIRYQIFLAVRRESTNWHEEPQGSCPPTFLGGCSTGSWDPLGVTTLYSYEVKDTETLKASCRTKRGPNGVPAVWNGPLGSSL